MLAVWGLAKQQQPPIKEIATQLCLEHHTVVELAGGLVKRNLLLRRTSPADKRVVLLQLSSTGRSALDRIVRYSFSQLREEAPALIQSLRRILQKSS